ncbi:MAG: hypothetical protein IKA71_06645 [Lentisphaeria bacterium]|nr:hypothetical protein [Lentisphaeria bacterium]
MFSITNFREGAVLNRHHGVESADALLIDLEGICQYGSPVRVNGILAESDGTRFSVRLPLTEKVNTIEAVTRTAYGEFSQKMTLVWDKGSFRRCGFYLDDNIFVFHELAKQRPRRAFDHFYLAFLKKMHERYGLKVTLNCFYRNDHDEFLLKDMPDIWKSEFQDNADWLKLALHAYSEFPDRPYTEASRQDFQRDYELMRREVTRFAGEASFIVPQVLHWANISPEVADELFKHGGGCYSESLRPRLMSSPAPEELPLEMRDRIRSEVNIPVQEHMARHYGFAEEIGYLEKHVLLYDRDMNIFFYHDWLICNLLELRQIPQLFAQVKSNADRFGNDVFSAGGHEQYSFPGYMNHQPDHFDKLETTIRLMVENAGCTPVFFQDGLMGNTAWGK